MPKLSIILIAYKMPAQLEQTLYTLSPSFQRNAPAEDYEIIVAENTSCDNLAQACIDKLPSNVRYHLRNEPTQSPVPAINFAFARCKGDVIGLILDGARMVSPGVIKTTLDAFAISQNALVTVPGYHLGRVEQHLHENAENALRQEKELLNSVNWQGDGYELFNVSTFSGANRRGYLQPIMECNCVFASEDNFSRIGYADTDFMYPGGGSINLHMYRSLGMLSNTRPFVLPGEGSFHQYHGGVTTSSHADRQTEIKRHSIQLHAKWPGGFHGLRRQFELFGRVPVQAMPFLEDSLERSQNRLRQLTGRGLHPWPDDTNLQQISQDNT